MHFLSDRELEARFDSPHRSTVPSQAVYLAGLSLECC